jgi:hypothetical protein
MALRKPHSFLEAQLHAAATCGGVPNAGSEVARAGVDVISACYAITHTAVVPHLPSQ